MTLDSLVELATFAAVVRGGSFTAAAERLGVSKSVVSRRVASLEERLGVRLLNRTTRRQDLTEPGLAVYERSARLLDEAAEAEIAASVHAETPRGLLTVNAPGQLSRSLLVPLLPAFQAKYPEVRVALRASDRFQDVVGAGFDLTLRIGGALDDASFVARRLSPVRLIVAASPDYLARRGVPRAPRDLVCHDCLRYTLMPAEREWCFDVGGERLVGPVTGPLAADSGTVLLEGALRGLGLVAIPDIEVRAELAAGRLVEVLADWPLPPRWLYGIYPHRAGVPPKVTVFLDAVTAALEAA